MLRKLIPLILCGTVIGGLFTTTAHAQEVTPEQAWSAAVEQVAAEQGVDLATANQRLINFLIWHQAVSEIVARDGVTFAQADRMLLRFLRSLQALAPAAPSVVAGARGNCAEWYDEAMAAGFSDDQWNTVDRIMFRESRCQPGAYNGRYGASGLMQILARYTDDCGGNPGDLFDPQFNLNCARWILDVQGWRAWSTY